MKILVVGHRGMLGTDIMATLGEDDRIELEGRDIDSVDITDEAACRDLVRHVQPDVIINSAAMTDVDGCEHEREKAFEVNGRAPGNLARIARENGALLVHFSTDYLFDGTKGSPYREDDQPSPLNVYGLSKLAGEEAVRQAGPSFIIIRTAWLFGLHGKSFPRTIVTRAKQVTHFDVVNDQCGSPTSSADLAGFILPLIRTGFTGTVHVANSGQATWFDIARFILTKKFGDAVECLPMGSDRLQRPARRPTLSVLDITLFTRLTGIQPRPWQAAIEDFLDRLESEEGVS